MTQPYYTFSGTKHPLSLDYYAPFTVRGEVYLSMRQYLVAALNRSYGAYDKVKAAMAISAHDADGTFDPAKWAKAIAYLKTVEVSGVAGTMWNRQARAWATEGTLAKFSQNPQLIPVLMSAPFGTLVYAEPDEKVWGVGLAESDPRVHTKSEWRGDNWYSDALQQVRQAFHAVRNALTQ